MRYPEGILRMKRSGNIRSTGCGAFAWLEQRSCVAKRANTTWRGEMAKKEDHGRPDGAVEEAIYNVNIPTPSHAERARTLVESLGIGTLCTLARQPAGYPYGSFVTFALEHGQPI